MAVYHKLQYVLVVKCGRFAKIRILPECPRYVVVSPSGGTGSDSWLRHIHLFSAFALYKWRSGIHYSVMGKVNGQSIGSTVSDVIGGSWRLSTATGSYPLGCSSVALLQVVYNLINTTTSISRFSSVGLLAIEYFSVSPLIEF